MWRISRREVLQSSGAVLLGSSLANNAVAATGAAAGGGIARLNYNENPYGPSPRARDALRSLGNVAWKYSYEEVVALRSLIAAREGVRPGNIFISEGSGEMLKLAALLSGKPGREIIATRPTFPMLPQYAARQGATVTWVDVNAQLGHDFPALSAAIGEQTSLVYVCNPNNPTGSLADPEELRDFIRAVPQRVCIVVDEAYVDFATNPERATVLDQVKAGANILITRSFSKLYGLAGLRIGYGIASEALISSLEAVRISIPNQAGVLAARASLGDAQFRATTRQKIGASAAAAGRLFDALELRHVPTQANFLMFDAGGPGVALVEYARARGVMIAQVVEPYDNWVRVSIGLPADMWSFERVLRAFVRRA